MKARSAGCELPPAAANTGRAAAAAPAVNTGLSNIDRDDHPSPTGNACSKKSLRGAVGVSDCGGCKSVSPQWKILCEQGQSRGPEPGQPTVEVKLKEENKVTETPKKIIIYINQYPRVTLCDIAQKCDVFSHGCGYILPDVLKTKVVRCFKQDTRCGFQFGPRLKHSKDRSKEVALAKNRKWCPRVKSEESVCQSRSLTAHQTHLKEHTAEQTLPGFLKSRPSEGSATCSASFSLGKHTKKGKCGTGMLDGDVDGAAGPGSRFQGAEICTNKRIKLKPSQKDGVLPSTPVLGSTSFKKPAKSDTMDRDKTRLRLSDQSQSCSEHPVGGNSTCNNCAHNRSCDSIHRPTRMDAAQVSSELFSEMSTVDTDEPESYTCQRVRVYSRKNSFSCARTYISWPFSNIGLTSTARTGTTAHCTEPVDSKVKDDSPKNEGPGPFRIRRINKISNAPTDPSSVTTHHMRDKDGEHILAEKNGESHSKMPSSSSDSKAMEFLPHCMEAEHSPASFPSAMATPSSPSQCGSEAGGDPVSASSLPVNVPKNDSSTSTPPPSALGLSDWETAATSSSLSSPFTSSALSSFSDTPSSLPSSLFLLRNVKSIELANVTLPTSVVGPVEKTFSCEEAQMTACSPSSSALAHNSDTCHSCESSLLLPQDEQESDEDLYAERHPPKLSLCSNTSPVGQLREKGGEIDSDEFMLPPVLSPVTTPQESSHRRPGRFSERDVEQEEMEMNKDTSKHKKFPKCHFPQIVNGNNGNCRDPLEYASEDLEGDSSNVKTSQRKPWSSPSTGEDVGDRNKEESRDESDDENDVEQGNTKSKVKTTLNTGDMTDPSSSTSSGEDDGVAFSDEGQPSCTTGEGSISSEIDGSERDLTEAEVQRGNLDEFTAFEQDILLVDVIQDDPELFGNLPKDSLLKLGPTRVTEPPKTKPIVVVRTPLPRVTGPSLKLEQRSNPVSLEFDGGDDGSKEDSNSRPWRPQCSSTSPKMQGSTRPTTGKQTRNMSQPDANNNHVKEGLERCQPIQTVSSVLSHIPPLMTVNGPRTTNPANMADFRRQKSNYCRRYFSESLTCGFKTCRYQHVPADGEEKLCVDTVSRFTKNPACLQKAGAVFTGYYTNNPPGSYFSMPVLLSLLWSLLKAGMVSDVFSVLCVCLTHKIAPGHEFLLALFNYVRQKDLMGLVPELMQLTVKMASAGLVLSLDCLDSVKNTPEFQQALSPHSLVPVSGNHKLSTGAPFPEYLNLAHAIVEIELCSKQENWRRMGEVFGSICQSSKLGPNQVEQISGRIAIALLSESKDKLSLPFAAFAETVGQSECEDSLKKSFFGRIGVSLMLRYYKTHQWSKGRRVVEVLSISKVNYSTLKGLFGNEDGASRCCLVTVATELFLLSGSVEGALNTLRENKWFLSSPSWPCEPTDLESRTRVLVRLAERTSHRDTLDVLSNLPGLKEPNSSIDISKYQSLFNTHVQVCVDRQTLPVASDTVDFMLCKNLAVEHTMLQILLNRLAKQNLWLRAREIFRHSMSMGYYEGVSAPPGFMTLMVPCQIGEVEFALAFEMFISVNASAILHLSEMSTQSLSITLKRTQSCEREYLSAGSRLLSAACILQPKVIIHYTAVNPLQEQVFTLDISSARCWLRHNHLWANEVWMH